MPKPTTLPEWCTDEVNMTAPSAGQKLTGWTAGQDGVSDYDNWAKRWAYLWLKWIDDGCPGGFTAEKLTVTGSTLYTGVTTVSLTADANNLNPLGTGTADGLQTINVGTVTVGTGSAASWRITGLVAGANGQEVTITNTSTVRFRLDDQSTSSTAANRIKFPARYTGVSSFIIVEAGGSVRLRYSTLTSLWHVVGTAGCLYKTNTVIPGLSGRPRAVLAWDVPPAGDYFEIQGLGDLFYEVKLPPNSYFDTWTIYVTKASTASATLTAQLYTSDIGSGVTATVGSAATYTAPATYGAVIAADRQIGSVATESYFIRVTTSGTWGVSTDKIRGVNISAWVPM